MTDNEKKMSESESLSELEEKKLRAAYASRKRKKRIKSIVSWALVILIIGTLYVMYSQYQADRAREAEAMNQSVYAETTVMMQSYQMSIDLSGYIEPYDIQEAKFRTTGPVTDVLVEEGDLVKKGQLLASIDSTTQQANLQNIRNQIEEAELAGSERDVELLRLQEKAALNTLDYTNIYANFDGVVTSVDVDEGDYFEAGDLTVLTLVDISKLKATVEIDEIDMQYVKEGMSAYLTFDSMPGKTVEAYVSYIPMLGRYSDSGIGVVDVELTIDNPPASIIPGYSFEGLINVEGDVSMLIVPQAAVTMNRGGVTTVNRKKADGSTETVQVQVQYLGENLVQILSSNIKEGDVLVYQTKSGVNSMMRDFTAIMGPSGSGKSTLMNMIGCLDSPTSGLVSIDGEIINAMDETELADVRNRKVGFIFQQFNLLPKLNALENVITPLLYSANGMSGKERKERAEYLLERVGLKDRMRHRPSELSGGQKQRVAIARALVNNPAILLADEPTGALDSKTGDQIMSLFMDLNEEGRTIVFVTHDRSLGYKCRSQVYIRDGKIVDKDVEREY